MLDEPTAGMSPSDRKDMTRLLARLKAETGITIVMTEHDMDIIFELADRLMVLNYGEVIAIGNPDAVRDDPTVRKVYLGRGHTCLNASASTPSTDRRTSCTTSRSSWPRASASPSWAETAPARRRCSRAS